MGNLLEVNGLCKNYPGFSLRDVTFSVPEGSIMGFIGENGAGKTTTLKLILDEIPRDGGTVKLFGHESDTNSREAKEQIGVVFDESFFYGEFSPKDIGRILRQAYRSWDVNKYQKNLKEFSVPGNRKIKGLSKGMKMKLSIACALAHHPRLLILDEATSGLDPVMRSDILDILLDFIQDESRGVLFSSHITSDLERVADYVTFLHQGKVVFSRSKDDVIEQYGLLKCGASQFDMLDPSDFLKIQRGAFECRALVPDQSAARQRYPHCVIDHASLDEIMTLYAKGKKGGLSE